ncbi:hypothetical protein JKP88DRAFT_227024, partial [Tribonema minus]
LTKKCRDPSDMRQQPETLPAGFSRYLLAKHWSGHSPGSLSTDDVAAHNFQRHGVEAILQHRVAAAARGRGHRLQYLIRWEGATSGGIVDSWEDSEQLDECPQVLEEYWSTLNKAIACRDITVAGSNTQVVKRQLRRAVKARGVGGVLAQCGAGSYELAPLAEALLQPPAAFFTSFTPRSLA